MSYKCPKCKEDNESNWCDECVVMTDHECNSEVQRIKDVSYGDGEFMLTIYISYCNECGQVHGINQ